MKKLMTAGFCALATMPLLAAQETTLQAPNTGLIAPSKGVPAKSHSQIRFEKICADLSLGEEQMKRAMELWTKTDKKLKATYDLKKSEGARMASLDEVRSLAEKQFNALLTKSQRARLGDLVLPAPTMAKVKPAEGGVGADPSASKKTCWSCWPGKCDRSQAVSDR